MTRTIQVDCYEQVFETTCMQVEIPDDLDLTDKEAVDEFLEEAFVQGDYKKVDLQCGVSIEERWFDRTKVLPT